MKGVGMQGSSLHGNRIVKHGIMLLHKQVATAHGARVTKATNKWAWPTPP